MDSKEIEAKVQEIKDQIAELHDNLIEDGQQAVIEAPCLAAGLTANLNEMELWFRIGKSED